MDNTEHFNIPKPRETDNIDVEMYRLQTAWDMLDAILFGFLTSINGKAPSSHSHTIEQISGLATALANKMAANKTFKLSELSDVLGMSDAPQGYVPVKNADGKVFFQSAAAAIGNHQHGTSDIQGLNTLIQQYVAAVVDSSPAALDTLKELANALGNDPNFATTVTNALGELNTKVQGSGAPIGTTIMMQGNGNTPPPGYLLHNGAPCTSAYPELRAWLLANGAAVNGNGDPIIEDMGGYFPRGWRSGQVVDSGRAFGSAQQDQFQNHRHPANRVTNATVSAVVNNNQQGPVFYIADGYVNTPQTYASGHGATLPDGDSGTPRTGAETRPVNKTFTYWIKAYAADQVPGSVDFAALANNLQALQTAVNSKGTKRQASITPSGNAFTLNGLPAGVQRVMIKLSGIQIASNGQIVVRLGTSGGVETSAGRYFSKAVGFAATSLQESSLTTGFLLNDASVGSAITLANYGVIELQRHAPGSNSWELSGTMTRGNGGQNIFVGGATLLDELTQIQFTTTAGNIAFSGNSSVAIEWEF